MTNPYYNATGNPPAQTRGSSNSMRSEFSAIAGGFDNFYNAMVSALSGKGAVGGQTWTGTHNFPATTYGVTATLGDSSLKYATTEFVANTAFTSALPAQLGNSGKLLTTNGTTASWSDTKTINGVSLVGAGNVGTGLVPLAVLTPTAAANVDFLSTFSGSYDSYLIVGTNINSNSGTSDQLFVRLANAGAVDTASNYANSSSIATAFSTTGTSLLITSNVLAAGKGVSFLLIVKNVNSSSGLKTVSVDSQYQTNATPAWRNEIFGHVYIGGTVSGVRFYWSAGANFIAQGSIKIFGIQN